MRDRRRLLKIKLKSLAAEVRIIRKAEGRLQIPALEIPPDVLNGDKKANAAYIRQAKRAHRAKFRGQPWYDANRADLTEIQEHRRKDLRKAARQTHLAYGFLRGRTYNQMEGSRAAIPRDTFAWLNEKKLLEGAAKMAAAYGASGVSRGDIERDFMEWSERKDAKLVYTADGGGRQGLVTLSPSPTEFGALIS